MKKLFVFFIVLLFSSFSQTHAQVGKLFPEMEGETLDDKVISIPHDTKGKFTLVGLASSKKSEDDLKTWFTPAFQTFIAKPQKNALFPTETYDVNVFFIPMFTGVNKAATGAAKKKMKEGLDRRLFPNVMVYKGEMKTYKSQLDLDDKDIPYFFVLDKEGKIVYATSGKYTDKKMREIEALLEEW
jgi:hypothetical protein